MTDQSLGHNGGHRREQREEYEALRYQPPQSSPLDLVRTRLFPQLDGGAKRRLTVLSGAAGTGKSTVVAQWARQTSHQTAWLTVEESDNDPALFLEHLVAALQRVAGPIGREVFNMLRAEKRPGFEQVLRRLLDDLSLLRKNSVVILDNYHLIHAAAVHSMIAFLVAYLPDRLHFFLIARGDPPFSLSELRASDQLKEIRAPFLAFTTDEAGALLNEVMTQKLAYGQITALVELAKGEALSLHYGGLALRHYSSAEDFFSDCEKSGQALFSFALERLLAQQPQPLRARVYTCAGTELCGPALYREISPAPHEADFFQKLWKEGLFFEAVDERKNWFRFHPLVQEQLLQLSPQREDRETLRKAALWFARNEMVYPAFAYALKAGDRETAAQLLEDHAQQLLLEGRLVTVEGWLEKLGSDLISARPMLSVCQAWVLIVTQKFEAVAPHLQNALQQKHTAAHPEEVAEHVRAIEEYLAHRK